jgi:hypothetical protein
MFNKKDRYRHVRDFKYICNDVEPPSHIGWLIPMIGWRVVLTGGRSAKPCFERRVPHPRYMTFGEMVRYTKELGYDYFPEDRS